MTTTRMKVGRSAGVQQARHSSEGQQRDGAVPGSAATSSAPLSATAAAAVVDVSKTYGKGDATVLALDRVTVSFDAQRFTALMGPSGSGKSTLLHCAAGLDRPTSGQVYMGDTEMTSLNEHDLTLLRRDRIGFIFQSYNLVPTLTAQENIDLPSALAGHRPDREWVDTVVQRLGLGGRLRHRPGEMSGGQQQRVAIARALSTRPQILFADEPTGNLDSRASNDILGLLRHAVDELRQTIVMVTHDPAAAAHADRVLFLADGRMVGELETPTTVEVLDRLKSLGD